MTSAPAPSRSRRFSFRGAAARPPAPPSARRRLARLAVYVLLVLAAGRCVLWMAEGFVDIEAKRRQIEFWGETVLGGPSVGVTAADFRLGPLGTAHLTLGQVQIEHPNADFIFGDPGRLGEPGRDAGECLTVEKITARLPLWGALGLWGAAAALTLTEPCLRLARNAFDESNLDGLWGYAAAAPPPPFPLGWPKVGKWRVRVENGTLELSRARAGVNMALGLDFEAEFDPATGQLSIPAGKGGEMPMTVAAGDRKWIGAWRLDYFQAFPSRDPRHGLATEGLSVVSYVRDFPLAALELFVDDWSGHALPRGATFSGRLQYADISGGGDVWHLDGTFKGLGLDGPAGPVVPDGTRMVIGWHSLPGRVSGWNLEGETRGSALSRSWVLRAEPEGGGLSFRYEGPEEVAEWLRQWLAREEDGNAPDAAAEPGAATGAKAADGLSRPEASPPRPWPPASPPTAWTWTDWLRGSAGTAPAEGKNADPPSPPLQWLRDAGARWSGEVD